MKSNLRRLYRRRFELQVEIHEINKVIAKLEGGNTSYGVPKRIHHVKQGCSRAWLGRSFIKTTKDWDLVDCVLCHKVRLQRSRPQKPLPNDWAEVAPP